MSQSLYLKAAVTIVPDLSHRKSLAVSFMMRTEKNVRSKLCAKLHRSVRSNLAKGIVGAVCRTNECLILECRFRNIVEWVVLRMPLEFDKHLNQCRIRPHIVVSVGWVDRNVGFDIEWKMRSWIIIDM
jgi:hypothetical protein